MMAGVRGASTELMLNLKELLRETLSEPTYSITVLHCIAQLFGIWFCDTLFKCRSRS